MIIAILLAGTLSVVHSKRMQTVSLHDEAKVLEEADVLTVQAAWDNHFGAFASQNVAQILTDYSAESVIHVYNQADETQVVYTGIDGARVCFEDMFAKLSVTKDLAAPVIDVHEPDGEQPGSVFLVWNCLSSGFEEATDTFIFDERGKIIRQNVVLYYVDATEGGNGGGNGGGNEPAVVTSSLWDPTPAGKVHSSWGNHFGAFGALDVDQILDDYVDESVITIYNHEDGSKTEYKGKDGAKSARECFTVIFNNLRKDQKGLTAPVVHVEESIMHSVESSINFGQVFLVWSAPPSGYARATDTFIFNSEGKIVRQNVVVRHVSVTPTTTVEKSD